MKYWRSYKTNSSDEIVGIKIKGYCHPFYCREGSSDFQIFRDFFLKSDYADIPIEAASIIDGGANIGAFTVLYKRKYPKSTIVAVEPDSANCEMFKLNTRHLQDVTLIEGGLAGKTGMYMKIINPDHAAYSFVTEYADQGFPSVSIQQIMKEQNWTEIDIVKLDIEGGEKELLRMNKGWLKNTRAMIIEVHDYKIPGCSNALIGALKDLDCTLQFSGENFIIINNELQP